MSDENEKPKNEKPAKAASCSSVNRHAFLTDKEGFKVPDPKQCILPAGHTGDHKAKFLTGKKNRQGEPEEKESFWNSAAETEIVLD